MEHSLYFSHSRLAFGRCVRSTHGEENMGMPRIPKITMMIGQSTRKAAMMKKKVQQYEEKDIYERPTNKALRWCNGVRLPLTKV